MESDFLVKTAKIIEEVRARTCIDKIDTEVLEEILQDALSEYCDALHECYDYGYEDGTAMGYRDGYADGRESGLEDGRAEAEYNNEEYTRDAVEIAYDEGYSLGYDDGYAVGRSESHSAV